MRAELLARRQQHPNRLRRMRATAPNQVWLGDIAYLSVKGAASRLLGLPEIEEAVAQCWKCARGPTPQESSCLSGACSCDYQKPTTSCAA